MSKRTAILLGILALGGVTTTLAIRARARAPSRAALPPIEGHDTAATTAGPDAASPPGRAPLSALASSPSRSWSKPPVAKGVPAFPDESSLMSKLHELSETNPVVSLQLAREGNARFPDSPAAPERTWILVKSLVNLGRFEEARAEAEIMVGKYPNDPRALDVRRHLLSNPP